jgi:hypothetical protein
MAARPEEVFGAFDARLTFRTACEIVTHHPIFPSLKVPDPADRLRWVVRTPLEKGIGLLAVHTPADRTLAGMSGSVDAPVPRALVVWAQLFVGGDLKYHTRRKASEREGWNIELDLYLEEPGHARVV